LDSAINAAIFRAGLADAEDGLGALAQRGGHGGEVQTFVRPADDLQHRATWE
jgi:hypothetical protein